MKVNRISMVAVMEQKNPPVEEHHRRFLPLMEGQHLQLRVVWSSNSSVADCD
jgi:hypothetical protein